MTSRDFGAFFDPVALGGAVLSTAFPFLLSGFDVVTSTSWLSDWGAGGSSGPSLGLSPAGNSIPLFEHFNFLIWHAMQGVVGPFLQHRPFLHFLQAFYFVST